MVTDCSFILLDDERLFYLSCEVFLCSNVKIGPENVKKYAGLSGNVEEKCARRSEKDEGKWGMMRLVGHLVFMVLPLEKVKRSVLAVPEKVKESGE